MPVPRRLLVAGGASPGGATVAAYYAGNLTVDARTYGDHMRALKQALHAPAVAR